MIRKRTQPRRGLVLAIVAVCFVVVVGVVALAIDGGVLRVCRRQCQASADAAALAAASVLYAQYPSYQGQDTEGSAQAAALALAADNGYSNDGVSTIVVVNIPPASGLYAGQASYAEVILTSYQQRYFANIFGGTPVPVRARAVARGAWVPANMGVLALQPTDKGAISDRGNGTLTEIGAPIVVDSNNAAALVVSGGGALRAPQLNITGGYTDSGGGQITGRISTGVHPSPDPLAYLPAPGISGAPPIPAPTVPAVTSLPMGNKQYDLYPGSYSSLPTFGQGDQVILHQSGGNPNSGIIYLASGGFNSTGASITMATGESGGVLIYNAGTGTGDSITISGSSKGTVNLTPLTSGPYQGMVFFQARNASEGISITGNGAFSITGTLYAPQATLAVAGNGSSASIGSQLISNQVSLSGNGNISNTYNQATVARTRIIALVE